MITVPQHRLLWSPADQYSFHKRRYAKKELVSKVERAGFKVVRIVSFVFLLLVPLLGSRLAQRWARGDPDPLAEYKIGLFLDSAFERILSVERAIIELGFGFPAGGSLLLIAKRAERTS